MKMTNKKTPETEEEILAFWEKNEIYKKLMARKGKSYFLLDGPPYANGMPHIGHVKNTVFKDVIIRTEFMKGKNVLFQPGFDTHGLPIENMVEKKLGLKDKKDIEKFGISKFMKECKNNAALNVDIWIDTYRKLGSLYPLKKPYLTYEESYVESGWWTFAQMYKKKMVVEGEKPVLWCPHCETSLAGYEVTDSYKDVTDPGVYLLFKLSGEDAFLLVYTTTPWTLPANVAIAVASKENYVKIEVESKKIILAEKRLQKISDIGFGYKIIETFKGEKLVGKKYEPLLDVPLQRELASGKLGKAHIVIASIPILKERVASKVMAKKSVGGGDLFEEFVIMDEGTGLVHSAPGHGKTDNTIGKHYGLACVSPMDDRCFFTPEAGFSGFVKSADKDIMNTLEREGKLLYTETITHRYPLCWRCKAPLIFRLSRQLFFSIDRIKEVMLKENKKVNWMPEFARERFNNWLENAEDWNISRQRYWGIPIPLWKCECGEEKVIENRNELEKLSKVKIADLHAVENVNFKCKCGKLMKKVRGILDVWFDSGIAPWASMGYPKINKTLFDGNFPVDRIHEAQDQIRGWFYSLMFCSAAVFEKAPYKAVSMTGWVVDDKGNKMSKSLGNVIDAQETIAELGADMTRFYFCWDTASYDVQKFNKETAKKEIGQLFNVLWNLQNLANNGKPDSNIENKWIISRLNSEIKNFLENTERFEMNTATRSLSDFIIKNLSRNYIQMTREKENGEIIKECLVQVLKLLAPIAPFITEKIWQKLRERKIVREESIHLALWPKYDAKKIDTTLEKDFANLLKVIEVGLKERDYAKIGLKWPLASADITAKFGLNKEMKEIIKNQLNVKNVSFNKAGNTKDIIVKLDTHITPELEAEGFAREISRKVQALRKEAGLVKSDTISLRLHVTDGLRQKIGRLLEFIKERTNSKRIEILPLNESSDDKGIKIEQIKEEKVGILFNK